MPRFNLGSFFNNNRFEDFFASMTGGSSGHDHINGTTANNVQYAGRGDDTIAGMQGNDTLNGGSGTDTLWGGSGNDRLDGGNGTDTLVGGFGADRMDGGAGNDVLLSTAPRNSLPPKPPRSRRPTTRLSAAVARTPSASKACSTRRTRSSPGTSTPTARSTGRE
jgi:hypothetical protein